MEPRVEKENAPFPSEEKVDLCILLMYFGVTDGFEYQNKIVQALKAKNGNIIILRNRALADRNQDLECQGH